MAACTYALAFFLLWIDQQKAIPDDIKVQLFYCFHRISVNMQRRIAFVAYAKFCCLKINEAAFFIYNIYPLHFIKTADLLKGLKQYTQFVLFGHDHYIQQAIGEGSFGCNGKVVAKLVAVGHRNKKGLGMNFLFTRGEGKRVSLRAKKVLHCFFNIGRQAAFG